MKGKKEGMKGRRRACYELDKSRMQEASKRSVQFSPVQSSSVQFSSERTNRAVAKFGREEVSNGGEEKCNSPFLVV